MFTLGKVSPIFVLKHSATALRQARRVSVVLMKLSLIYLYSVRKNYPSPSHHHLAIYE
jgi:hypothetical protein